MTAQIHPIAHAPAARAGGPETSPLGFDLRDVLRILSERRMVILGVAVLGLLLGIAASMLMTPMYRANTILQYDPQAGELADTSRRSQGTWRANSQEAIGTQIGLLSSETLSQRVAQDLNLAAVPAYGGEAGTRQQRETRAAAILRGNTAVESVKGSTLIRVSHVSTDPVMAAKIANGIAKGFIASNLERRFDSSAYARNFLSDQLARTKSALEDSERALNAYSIQSGDFRTPGAVVDGKQTEGTTLAAGELGALYEALNTARVKRIAAEQAWRNSSVAFIAEQASNLSDLVQQRTELQAKYDEQLKTFKPDYPMMRELKARIDRIESSINSERSRASNSKRAELEGEFKTAERIEAQLRVQVAAAKGDVQGERSRSIQYNILQREADTNRALYDALLQRFKEVGVSGGIGQSEVSIVDPAKTPGGPYRPNLLLNSAVGIVLGLALGVGLAFAIHLLLDTVVEPADVRQKLHLPVLGVIPLETEDRTLMEALADRKSDVSEAYYSVRTALKFSQPEGAPKTLVVTSTKPGEGKSTTAYAIASSMARLGAKVLLIDADLRKPTFVSSREDGYGLAHLLGSEEPLSTYTETTQVENLSLLPVGRFVGSAAELLSSNRLPSIVGEAREDFDMVVIDGPPVLGLTDAPLLGSVAEATALVIESRASRTSDINEMIRRLNEAGTRLVGVILTKVTQNGGNYGYRYYSYSYGSDDVGGRVSSNPARKLDIGRAEA